MERITPYTSPSAHVILPLDFWETSLDTRNRSDEFQKTISDSSVSPEIYEWVHTGVTKGHQEKDRVDVAENVTKN